MTAARSFAAAPTARFRIGVEFLPPEDDATAAPEVDRTTGRRAESPLPSPRTPLRRTLERAERHTWALGAGDLAAIDDPIERATLRFMDDLVREDQRRTEREVRLPFLDWQPADLDLGQRLWSEAANAEAQQRWVDENGLTVLSRPLRQLARRLPLISDLELELHDFRSSFVPMSEPYREAHADDRSLGRLSLRLDPGDLRDPLEVVYIRSGIRIGSGQDRAKLSVDWPLSENVTLTVRTRRNYVDGDTRLRADLRYRHSDTMSLRFAIGDDMDFLSTSSVYSLFEAPMDGAPGMLLYAVHVF